MTFQLSSTPACISTDWTRSALYLMPLQMPKYAVCTSHLHNAMQIPSSYQQSALASAWHAMQRTCTWRLFSQYNNVSYINSWTYAIEMAFHEALLQARLSPSHAHSRSRDLLGTS